MKHNWEGFLGRVQLQEDPLRATALKEANFQVSECSDSSLPTFCPPSHPSPPQFGRWWGGSLQQVCPWHCPSLPTAAAAMPSALGSISHITSNPQRGHRAHQREHRAVQQKSNPRDKSSQAEIQPHCHISFYKGQVEFGINFQQVTVLLIIRCFLAAAEAAPRHC